MSQPYKLRLSDGTVLLVDQDGLDTWLVDNKAMVQAAGSQQWRPLSEFLAEERAAAMRASRRRSSLPGTPPLVPPPREDDAPHPAASPPEDPLQMPPFMSEAPSVQVLAEETGSAGPQSTPQQTEHDEIPSIRFKPLDDEAPPHPTVSSWLDSLELPSVSERSSLQVLADDPAARPAGYPQGPSTPDDSLPIIPLKPLSDEPLARAAAEPAAEEDDGHEVVADTAQRERPRGAPLRLLSAFGTLLSRLLEPIGRLQGGLPASLDGGYARRRSASDEGLAVIPPKPFDEEEPPLTDKKRPSVRGRVSGWLDRPTAWVGRLTHRERPSSLDAPAESRAARPAGPAPSEPLRPPPATSELPVLPFADVDEAGEARDVDEAEEGEGLVDTVWLWTKRVVVIAGLVTGGVFAALSWESWFPKAVLLGKVAVAEIDKHVRSLEEAGRHREALATAAERLPHLAPETIQLVLSTSPTGFLDPAEAFQIACEAADRGLPALTAAEAEELKALRRELLDTLTRAERERIREYDEARARRVTFAFEDRDALEPFARGARALPAQSRERLQSLLGKAIAAGLVPTAAGAPQHPTGR